MLPGKTYHLFTHANGSENLFLNDENYRFFLQRYRDFIDPIADTYAYCLMSNHIHFMIHIKEYEGLLKVFEKSIPGKSIEYLISRKFASLFSSYTQSFNKVNNRMGSLFIPNFKRKEVSLESYFTALILYIHLNPVKHGCVKKLNDWRLSSYESILRNDASFVKSDVVLEWFGGRELFKIEHEALQKTITPRKFITFGEL